jgi:hypothetical protein
MTVQEVALNFEWHGLWPPDILSHSRRTRGAGVLPALPSNRAPRANPSPFSTPLSKNAVGGRHRLPRERAVFKHGSCRVQRLVEFPGFSGRR